MISDDDLTLAATQVLSNNSVADGQLPLTVPILSQLYRLSRLAAVLKIKMADYLTLLGLAGLSITGSATDVATIVALKSWLDKSGMTLAQLDFVVANQSGANSGALDPAAILPFMELLWQLSQSWLLQPSAFVYDQIDVHESALIFNALQATGQDRRQWRRPRDPSIGIR